MQDSTLKKMLFYCFFKVKKQGVCVLISGVLLVSCEKKIEVPIYNAGDLVSFSLVGDTRTIADLTSVANLVKSVGLTFDATEIKYDVDLYTIVYKTTYKGELVDASGLVALPKNTTKAFGMFSYQHGTIVAHSEAPTQNAGNLTSEVSLVNVLSGTGFIGVIPDYIGFGASKQILHPYYVADVMAGSVVDMLKAAKKLSTDKNVIFNNKLFLVGYSEGGYVTMATHKYIEKNGLDGFQLTASFPASGGYYVKKMQEKFFTLTQYDNPFYIAFVALSYKNTYSWTNPLSDMFQEPYTSKLVSLFDGTKKSSDINKELTTSIPNLINADAIKNFDTDAKYKNMRDALVSNSLIDWTPNIPMYMYHGDADVTVFYENSVDTYNLFLSKGAKNVTLTTIPNGNHLTSVYPYINDVAAKLLMLR
ncbi:MAG: lipase family protein [Chitinophagaceae bacterium]|nr:lipase family protein [Chitinophagaceae bacterium]